MHLLPSAAKVNLLFTEQKNQHKNKTITQDATTDSDLCPVQAAASRVRFLRNQTVLPTAPLQLVPGYRPGHVTTTHCTTALCQATRRIGSHFGIQSSDINACALRAGGTVALLCAGVDPAEIRLMVRWRSWALHAGLTRLTAVSSSPPAGLSTRMLAGGQFCIHTHATLPADLQPQVHAFLASANPQE